MPVYEEYEERADEEYQPQRRFRVHMVIQGSMVKPSYEGHVDVCCRHRGEAFDAAVRLARATAHGDSAPDSFRLKKIEELPAY